MKVLHVIPTLAARTGGPPAAVVASSLALGRMGVTCTIVATDMAEAASALRHARIETSDMPPGAERLDLRLMRAHWPQRLAFAPSMLAELGRTVREYDVVHIHSLFLFPQFAAFLQASRRGVPYVVSPRGALDPHLRRRGWAVKSVSDALWQRRLLESAAAIHVTSDEEARLIADVAPNVRRAVIPNGIDWASYQALPPVDAFRASHGIAADAPLVIYLGRLSHKKGIDVLIEAFTIVRRSLPEARLAICGPDDEGLTPKLRAAASHARCADAVTFAGMLHREDKLAALAAADVWALPSLTENFGIAVVEAMAAGVPAVISPNVNIAREIAEAAAGVVAARSAEAFAGAIGELLMDREQACATAERGRAFARRYDWDAVAPQLAEMYEQVTRRHDLQRPRPIAA